MQEFSSISVSSYEAESLSERLTEQSAQGWSVVAVVPAGSQVVAYLSRESTDGSASPIARDDSESFGASYGSSDADSAIAVAETGSIADVAADEPVVANPVEEAPGWAVVPDAASTVNTTTSPDPVPAATATPDPTPAVAATTSTAAAAPAGWYADPSARYDLRYWDGSDWTEHVSRNGQQSTDPPVA